MAPAPARAHETGRVALLRLCLAVPDVAPRWSAVALADIRYSDVQAWVASMAAERGPVIVRTAHSVLARILDDAVRARMLASNPARGVKLPKRPPVATCI